MKASDLFVKALEKEGVEYIFGIPGEENLDLLDSIRRSKSIRFVLTRHEQAAGFMAASYGRLTEKPGVCLSTLGPGLTNLVTSTAYSLLGAMPSIIISGQKPILESKQGKFQIINAIRIMSPITKWSKQIIAPHSIPGVIREAFRIASEERPGPVHIELPEDIASMETDHHLYEAVDADTPLATKHSIEKAVKVIEDAESPLILIGSSTNRKATTKPLKSFIEKTGIPFFTTQMGKGVVDERHPAYVGTAALSDSDILHSTIKKSDVIINIGHEMIEKPPFLMAFGKYGKRQVIHINFSPAEIDDIYFPQHQVIGDIAHSLSQITEKITTQAKWNHQEYLDTRKKIDTHLTSYVNDTRFPLLPLRIIHNMRTIIPEDGIVCLDNGMYKIWFSRNYKSYRRYSLILDNALATMGAGLPTAIATKLKYPERPVIAVCGDGGFMMNAQELETVVRLGIDITIIVLNDSSYGMIKWKQDGESFESFGLDFTNPDFVTFTEAHGGVGYRPQSDEEFSKALHTAINGKGLHLIDTAIDYSLDKQIFEETRNI